MKYFLAVLMFAAELHAAPLTIIPNGSSNSLVTAGIPFAACALPDAANFKLLNDKNAEVPIFIRPTMYWPESRCEGRQTVRAVKIQFSYDPERGEATYDWQLTPRTLPDLQEAPISEVPAENPARAGYMEPAFFAINDPAYLVSTGLISPTTVAGKNDYDREWYPKSFEKRVSKIDFKTTQGENWLFDSVSAIYQQALRSGSLEQYREAYLEHEFWISKMDVVNSNDIGGFTLDAGDTKYIYLTPMKLHLALTGDDSWTPQENGIPHPSAQDRATLIQTIVTRSMGVLGVGVPYTETKGFFTERNAGFALQRILAAYELTADPALLANLNTIVNNLQDMMTANPDGEGNHGYLSHSWHSHEGWYPAYIGKATEAVTGATTITMTNLLNEDWKLLKAGTEILAQPYGAKAKLTNLPTLNSDGTITLTLDAPVTMREWEVITTFSAVAKADRAFSPWMQAVLVDGLWQYYNLTGDAAVKTKIAEMLLGFGRAITAYGMDGLGMSAATKSKIESAFGVTVVASGPWSARGIVPYTRYAANHAMSGAPASYIRYMMKDGDFSDQHSAESLFQISIALRFETDPAKKEAMAALAKELTAWFDGGNVGKTIQNSYPARYFNWSNKPDAWGTYEATMQMVE